MDQRERSRRATMSKLNEEIAKRAKSSFGDSDIFMRRKRNAFTPPAAPKATRYNAPDAVDADFEEVE